MPQPLDEDFANDLNKEERNEQFDDVEMLEDNGY